MAIAFRNASVGKSAAGGGTYSVTKPTGTVDGDVLIAVVSLDAGTASTITWPAGWTLIRYDNDGSGFSVGQEIRYRVASGEGASWSWTVTGVDSQCAVLCYSGAATPTPPDVSNGGPAVTTATCNAPSVTPTLTDDLLLCIYSSTHNGTPTASTITLDAALTSRVNSLSTGSVIRLAIGDKQLASAAATGNITATMVGTTDTKIGSQVALKTGVTDQTLAPTGPDSEEALGSAALTQDTVQTAAPVSDVTAGAWTPSTGVDLFAMVDEPAIDDTDWIVSSANPQADLAELALGPLTDPASSDGHVVQYRIRLVS